MSSSNRIVFLDNLKGLLILLVVAGHFLLPVKNENVTSGYLFNIIYLFHMPLFVFVSGFFAKSIFKNGRLRVEKIASVALLAVLFQITVLLGHPEKIFSVRILSFSAAPWYLLSLASWYALVPLLKSLRPLPAVVISVCIALAVGCSQELGSFLAIARTCVFLPFFVLGYYCTKNHLIRIRESKLPTLCAVLAIVFMIAYAFTDGACAPPRYLVYGRLPYRGDTLTAMVDRLEYFAIAVVFSLAVLRIVPSKKTMLSQWGKQTLAIYILHRLVCMFLRGFGFYKLAIWEDPVLGTLSLLVISVVVTALFAHPVFAKPFDALMGMKWRWLANEQDDSVPSRRKTSHISAR